MTRNDFIQTTYQQLLNEDTTSGKARVLLLKRATDAADTLEEAGVLFDLPDNAAFDQQALDAVVAFLHEAAQDGLLRKGMAGPCILLNENLTAKMFALIGREVPNV